MSAQLVDTTTGEVLSSAPSVGELVPVDNMAALDTLTPEARDLAVGQMLDQARAWLAHVRAATDTSARDIAEFKAWVATAAEASRRVKVSKECQLDAEEIVRRSERELGVAIRRGQRAGEIRTTASGGPRGDYIRNGSTVHVEPVVPDANKVSPKEFLKHAQETVDVYDMTDDVTDEHFDQALAEAKAEGNLSRANVVRKLKAEPTPKSERHELLRKTRRIDPNRVAREAVQGLEGIALTIDLIDDYTLLDPEMAQEWAASLTTSLRTLNRFNVKIKETTHVHDQG